MVCCGVRLKTLSVGLELKRYALLKAKTGQKFAYIMKNRSLMFVRYRVRAECGKRGFIVCGEGVRLVHQNVFSCETGLQPVCE